MKSIRASRDHAGFAPPSRAGRPSRYCWLVFTIMVMLATLGVLGLATHAPMRQPSDGAALVVDAESTPSACGMEDVGPIDVFATSFLTSLP